MDIKVCVRGGCLPSGNEWGELQNGGAGGRDMLIPDTMQVQCKGRERPFWRPSSPDQSPSTLIQPLNHATPPSLVCDVCVCHRVWCSVPFTLRSCIPPFSPSSLPHPITLYRAAVTAQSRHEQVPLSCHACHACLSRPAFPCFWLILIAPNSGGFLRHVFTRVRAATCGMYSSMER
jgi:hypothetical protein